MLKILVHDWSGFAFPIDLSRELARRGSDVLHAYFEGVQGPKGYLDKRPDDPQSFTFVRRTLPEPYAKYGAFKRRAQETRYGREMAEYILALQPDVVISSDTPLDVQKAMMRATSAVGAPFIFWFQDILSIAMKNALRSKFGFSGALIGDYYSVLERSLLCKANHVVCICDEFAEVARARGVQAGCCTVIENWAPRDEIYPMAKDNAWARTHGLVGKAVFLYAGTLGLKHNPEVLLRLAAAHAHNPSVIVVVASEGLGAEWLKTNSVERNISGLMLLPFQPYKALPEMLASADVLVGLLEPDAARFAVPSKILSYLAAGRPVLLSMPRDNQVAKLVEDADAGIVTMPGDHDAFLTAAKRLLADTGLRERYAANARRCAEEKFDIVKIGDRFMEVIEKARSHKVK